MQVSALSGGTQPALSHRAYFKHEKGPLRPDTFSSMLPCGTSTSSMKTAQERKKGDKEV